MSVTTPNMNLIEPVIATDTGLTWENSINANSTIIDQHNHTSGNGVQIPPAGLNINTALTFNNQQATNLNAAVFYQQSSSISTLNALFVKTDGNLYYNDGVGDTSIKITSGGSVNATTSGIASGSASASFSSGVLVVNSNTNTPGNISCGSILLGNVVAGSKFLTLAPPASMAASYTLNLPNIPGILSFLTLDTSGNIATASNVSPTQIAAASITGAQIGNGAITNTNIAAGTITSGNIGTGAITATNIASQTITQGLLAPRTIATNSNPGAGGVALSSVFTYNGSGTANVNIASITLTTTGRPVFIGFQAPSNNADSFMLVNNNSLTIEIVNSFNSSIIYEPTMEPGTGGAIFPPSTIWVVDTSIAGSAGTYTWTIASIGGNSSTTYSIANVQVIAYEI